MKKSLDKTDKMMYNLRKMKNTRLTIELDEWLKAQAKSRAYAENKTLKEKIIQLLNEWLREK